MLFYSRENGRDGEKDYLDTADFRDVYFEEDNFNCVSDKDEKVTVTYNLYYVEQGNIVGLEGIAKVNGETITRQFAIEEPHILVEQGAEAYYNEKLIDDVAIIKTAKESILTRMKSHLLENDYLLVGTTLNVMALLINNGNTIAVLDNITINSSADLMSDKFYSILELSTINAGELSVYITNNKKLVGQIDNINIDNGKVYIKLAASSKEELESSFSYIKSTSFETREEYDENRAQYIKVESNVESDFDEFDDLF